MEAANLGIVLVTGGTGFLGTHLILRLLAGDYATKVISASRKVKSGSQSENQRVIQYALDITSPSSVDALFKTFKPTTVIHTASPPPRSHTSVLEATNVLGTKNLLAAASSCPETKVFIYTSSDSACYPSPFKQITEQECQIYSSIDAPNQYGRTKAIADASVLAANSGVLKTAILRIPSIYGEDDPHFVPQIVESVRNDQWRNQIGHNEKIFEYVYVESAAEAHILAARALLSGKPGSDGEAYFVTDGVAMPFFDFMRKCYAAAGCRVVKEEIKVIPFWVVQMMASIGEWAYWISTFGRLTPKMRRDDIDHLDTGCHWNIEKARTLLGYMPIIEQDEAVRKTMEWAMKNST